MTFATRLAAMAAAKNEAARERALAGLTPLERIEFFVAVVHARRTSRAA